MSGCRYEAEIAAAARGGNWTETLRDHAASCLICAETAVVVAALAEDVGVLMGDDIPLPDPRMIWIRSRLTARQERSLAATRVITWTRRLALLCAVVVAFLFEPGLWGLVSVLKPASLAGGLADLPVLISGPAAVFGLTFVVMSLMVMWNERSTAG